LADEVLVTLSFVNCREARGARALQIDRSVKLKAAMRLYILHTGDLTLQVSKGCPPLALRCLDMFVGEPLHQFELDGMPADEGHSAALASFYHDAPVGYHYVLSMARTRIRNRIWLVCDGARGTRVYCGL
jgi:hypothetical protein